MYRSLLLSFLLLLSALNAAAAKIYEYTDDSGKKVFVDRLSKVPAKYREQLESRKQLGADLSQTELDQLKAERDRQSVITKIALEKRKINEAMKEWTTSFRFQSNRILIPVKVSYGSRSQTLTLVMDTGASRTVLHKDAIGGLAAQYIPGGAAQVADGRVVKTERINLDKVQIGPYEAKNVQMAVVDFHGGSGANQGLLGMDFLYNARYELDRDAKQIKWFPEKFQAMQDKLQELEKLEQQLKSTTAVPSEE